MKLIRFRLPLFRCSLIYFFVLVLFSCGPSFEDFHGEWISKGIIIKINTKKNTFELQNFSNSKDSFLERIKSIEKNLEDKWLIKLTGNKKITLKIFNENTMFLYSKIGYVRLKKKN